MRERVISPRKQHNKRGNNETRNLDNIVNGLVTKYMHYQQKHTRNNAWQVDSMTRRTTSTTTDMNDPENKRFFL